MRRVDVLGVNELPNNGIKRVEVDGTGIVLIRLGDVIRGVQAECSHEAYPLEEGILMGDVLTCIQHGSQFDLKTGEPIGPPADVPLKIYNVEVCGDRINVLIQDTSEGSEPI